MFFLEKMKKCKAGFFKLINVFSSNFLELKLLFYTCQVFLCKMFIFLEGQIQ